MDLAQLRLLVATARLGNLTRAAGQLGVTQSTASRWLQAVEHEVGGALLERSAGGLRLTPLGAAFLPYAERAVRAVDEGLATVRDARAGRGRLRLGCSDVTSTYVLPGVLRGFRQAEPTTDVRVRVGPSRAITQAVADGDLEVGLVDTVDDPRLQSMLLQADAYVFVLAPDDRLARAAGTGLADLAARGVILYGMDEQTTAYGLAPFLAAHLTPRVVMEVDSVETAKQMVAEGFGCALLPRMAVAADLAAGRLAAATLAGIDLGHWHVRLVRRANAALEGAAAGFWDWCAAHIDPRHPHL